MLASDDAFADVRVLILDDNRNFQTLLRTLLRHLGFRQIDVFDEPGEARRHAATIPVDLAFVDLMMPGASGLDWVRTARRGAGLANPEMAIVMVTGHAARKVVDAAIDGGIDGFLVKPLSPESLHRHVSTILGRPRAYVQTADGYYGPDLRGGRRRRSLPIEGPLGAPVPVGRTRRLPTRTVPGFDVARRDREPAPVERLETTFLD